MALDARAVVGCATRRASRGGSVQQVRHRVMARTEGLLRIYGVTRRTRPCSCDSPMEWRRRPMAELSVLFAHVPHAWTRQRLDGTAPPPPKVDDERVGLNGKLGLFI